jgi:integrase
VEPRRYIAFPIFHAGFNAGGMAEWLKAHAWKACIRETVSWVRIPLPPPGPDFSEPSQTDVAAITAPGKYRFGPGLYLQVAGPDAKSWIYRFTVCRKERFMGLGSARDVTLAQARKRVEELRVNHVSKKIDPLAERKAAVEAKRVASAKAVPFRVCGDQFIAAHEGEWRNPKHRAQWRATLETYAFPVIGDLPATAITAAHIAALLRPIWVEKAETARRVRQRIAAVLDYAADPDDSAYRNPAALTPQLKKALPRLGKARRPSRHPSLAYDEGATFMAALRAKEKMGVTAAALALQFTILTAARTNEAIGAGWSEIDLKHKVWTIPTERMKAQREHRVPLCAEALRVLERARALHNGDLVFPSRPFDRQLSSASMMALLKRMGRTNLTVHGFRSTFRTWAAERTMFPREVAEAALAHLVGDDTERAYQRGDLFEKRRKLMAEWGQFLG